MRLVIPLLFICMIAVAQIRPPSPHGPLYQAPSPQLDAWSLYWPSNFTTEAEFKAFTNTVHGGGGGGGGSAWVVTAAGLYPTFSTNDSHWTVVGNLIYPKP